MVQTNIEFKGWKNCVRISNGEIELIATTDVGPRIIAAGFAGRNLLYVEPHHAGKTGGDNWRIYGGHRLWHAPEAMPRTYAPDNEQVRLTVQNNTIVLIQRIEITTGIGKSITISMARDANEITIVHELSNHNLWPVELSVWPITMFAAGGIAIIPQEPYGEESEYLLPARPVALWQFTKMSDPRWRWGDKYIRVVHDPRTGSDQKLGVANKQGWSAYLKGSDLFAKIFEYREGAVYPDFGCNNEIYFNDRFVELETLSPLTRLDSGEQVSHAEHWIISKATAGDSEKSVDENVLPIIKSFKKKIYGA